MMKVAISDLQEEFAGMRVNKNIYNRSGTLVISKHTVLTTKHLLLLHRHGIVLCQDDIEDVSAFTLVNAAVQEIKQVFAEVKQSHLIPYCSLREQIVPLIVQMEEHPMIDQLLTHLRSHDEYTYRHSIGVALFARMIGKGRKLSEQEMLDLTIAGLLHDIGKLKIPDHIIQKPGKLTPEEFDLIRRHTIFGYELIERSEGSSMRQAIVALQHHEREDGSGYPHGIKGCDIDEFSKIVAVADVFHAMISNRSYKKPVPFYNVLQELSEQAYSTLEPVITLNFVKQIMDLTVGNRVILSNGCEGTIVMIHSADPIHPLVNVNGTYIDLSKERSLLLERIC